MLDFYWVYFCSRERKNYLDMFWVIDPLFTYVNINSLRGIGRLERLFIRLRFLALIGLPPLALFIVKTRSFA
jgi:hypothetical protein